MSLLKKITKGRLVRPQKIVVYAPEGWGKSTLASKLPDPIFLDTEGSTHQMDVNRINVRSYPMVMASVQELVTEKHSYRTLVIDTIDWCDRLIADHIVANANSEKIRSIEHFGYGKGWVYLAEEFNRFLIGLNDILRKGIHVCLLAHAKVVKFEPPDESQGYDRYELKLSKGIGPMVKEWADCVLFGNFDLRLRENDAGRVKATGGKDRLLHTTHTAAWDAKNRYRLPEIIQVEDNPDAPLPVDLSRAFGGDDQPPAAPAKVAPPQPKPSGPAWIADVRTALQRQDIDEEMVTAFLVDRGEIPPGASWRQVGEVYAARVARNPEQFVAAVSEWSAETAASEPQLQHA